MSSNYYEDLKWCPKCRDTVRYLQALEQSFCCACGGPVRMYRDVQHRTRALAGWHTVSPRSSRGGPRRDAS